MNTRTYFRFPSLLALVAVISGSALSAQEQPAGQQTIAVAEVKVGSALKDAQQKAGKINEFARVIQALDGQLVDALQQTRKFKIIARSDLDAILKSQDFDNSGNVDLNSAGAAKRFQISGTKYLVVPSVEDFQDFAETATFEGMGKTITRRVIRIGGVVRIYDTTTAQLLETANVQVSNQDVEEMNRAARGQGSLSDMLLSDVAREWARRAASRVEDVIYPARVLAKTGKQVTFSRGDGSTVAVDQIWEVFARGEELIDPDTGVSLGAEEVSVGKIRVNRVQPKFSTGMAIEDFGIEKGAVLRPVTE